MKYLSTTEAAAKWQISSRRVAKLAEQGRIEGAVIVGNNWLIPESADKPADGRMKKSALNQQDSCGQRYMFPVIIYCVRSDEQVESEFDTEEKRLLSAIYKYEATELDDAIEALEDILNTTERSYIKLGALYYLHFAYRDSRKFDKAVQALAQFMLLSKEIEDHKEEMEILSLDFNSYFDGFDELYKAFKITPSSSVSDSSLPFMAAVHAYVDVTASSLGKGSLNINAHEIMCRSMEAIGYFYAAMMLHFCLYLMHLSLEDEVSSNTHLMRAIDIAVEHKLYSSLCYLLSYFVDFQEVLKDKYPPELAKQMADIANDTQRATADLLVYYGKTNLFSRLNNEDHKYISYIFRNFTTNEIAKRENQTIYAVRKELDRLFGIFKVSSKKELLAKYSEELLNRK